MAIIRAVRSWLPFCYYFYFYALPERRNLPLDGVHPRIQELTFYAFTVRVPTSVLTQRTFNERILVFLSHFLAHRFGDGVSRASRKARRRLYENRAVSPPRVLGRLFRPRRASTRRFISRRARRCERLVFWSAHRVPWRQSVDAIVERLETLRVALPDPTRPERAVRIRVRLDARVPSEPGDFSSSRHEHLHLRDSSFGFALGGGVSRAHVVASRREAQTGARMRTTKVESDSRIES